MSYQEKHKKLSLTLKYPDKTSFTYSNLTPGAEDDALLDVTEAIGTLQSVPYSAIVRTDTTNIYFEL